MIFTGRAPAPGPARGAPSRRAADPYADDQYGMYEGGDGAQAAGMYGEEAYVDEYGNPYGGAAPSRRGAAPPSQARSSAGGRAAEGRGY